MSKKGTLRNEFVGTPAYKGQKTLNYLARLAVETGANHIFCYVLVQFLIAWAMARTGKNWLEPAVLGVFWSPILATLLSNPTATWYDKSDWNWVNTYRGWLFRWRTELFFLNWAVGAIGLHVVFWRWFVWLDVEAIHPFRETLGNSLGSLVGWPTAGQNLVFLLLVVIFGILAFFQERYYYREDSETLLDALRHIRQPDRTWR